MNEWRFIDKPVFTEWLPTSTFCPLKLFQTVTYWLHSEDQRRHIYLQIEIQTLKIAHKLQVTFVYADEFNMLNYDGNAQ